MPLDPYTVHRRILDGDAARLPDCQSVRRIIALQGGGLMYAWRVVDTHGQRYVAKFPENERPDDAGHTTLVAELAAARLGSYFRPRITPPFAILQVSEVQTAAVPPQMNCEPPTAGFAFGSRIVQQHTLFRRSCPVIRDALDPAQAARLIVFQTWLDGGWDPHLLVDTKGRWYSIDHAECLRNAHDWEPGQPAMREEEQHIAARVLGFHEFPELGNHRLFERPLAQLAAISDERIVDAFGDIPAGWWQPLDTRVRLAPFALARRSLVPKVIAAMWPRE